MGAKIKLSTDVDLTQVDGVPVEARTSAKLKTTGVIANDGRTEFEADGIDEIMLADGRVLYQCVYRPNGCGRTFPSPGAVRSHLKVHAGKATVVRALTQVAELETALAEVQRENKSLTRMKEHRDQKIMGLQADLRQLRADYEAKLAELQQGIAAEHADRDPMDREQYDAAVKALKKNADAIAAALSMLVSDVSLVVSQVAPPDPELVEKAARYDQFKSLLT